MDEKKIDYGSVQIHKQVLEDICIEAIKGIEGVRLIDNNFGYGCLKIFGIRRYQGIGISIDKDNQVNINLKVSVRLGMNIPDVANKIQTAIREAVEKTAEVDLRDISIEIQNMERGAL